MICERQIARERLNNRVRNKAKSNHAKCQQIFFHGPPLCQSVRVAVPVRVASPATDAVAVTVGPIAAVVVGYVTVIGTVADEPEAICTDVAVPADNKLEGSLY